LYELRLRQVVARGGFIRGHVDVHVWAWSQGAAMPIHVNRELVQAYLKAADEIAAADGCDRGTRRCGAACGLPGSELAAPRACRAGKTKKSKKKLGRTLDTIASSKHWGGLDEMRRAEGRHLVDDLRGRLARIEEITEQVRGTL